MSFGNIVDQILKEGFGERKASRDRVGRSAQNLQAQPGIDGIVRELQNTLGGGGGQGFQERARDFLRSDQAKGLSGGQIGGIGAAAGLLLGGGLGGAVRGGALAVLGTLAYSAYRRAQGEPPEPEEIGRLTAPETERLLVRAMIAAAKADGRVSQSELDRIFDQLGGGEVTAEEKSFVFDQLRNPARASEIAEEVSGPAMAAEVYAASLMAVDGESPAERAYLSELAEALGLDGETVAYLHEQTGTPDAGP